MKSLLTIFCTAILTVSSLAQADEAGLITFGFNDASAYPYLAGTGTELASPPGLSVELVQYVADRLDLPIRFERQPGMRVLHSLRVGKLDGAFLFSYRKAREEFGVYPMSDGKPDANQRLATLGYTLYKRPKTRINWDGKKFTGFTGRIAANLNYSIVADLRKLGITVTEGRSTAQSFRMLFADRVDAVADQETIADSYLTTIDHPMLEKVTPPLSKKAYFLLFSHQFMREHADIARRFWSEIARTRDRFTDRIAYRYANGAPAD